MSVSRCREAAQRDAGAVGQQRAFRVLLTPIHGGFASCLATARRLDDAAVHGEVLQVQPDDLVVGLQTQLLELAEHTGGDPLVAASTDRGARAGRVRDAFVGRSAAVDPESSGPRLFFQRVPEGKQVKNRVHLDVRAAPGLEGDARMAALDAEAERLVALGAARVERHDPEPPLAGGHIVMRDPEGNEFCLD